MGYYDDDHPRHGHRTPTELTEDELLSALHGKFCGMPASFDETGPVGIESTRSMRVSLLPWADSHPLESVAAKKPRDAVAGAPVERSAGLDRANKRKERKRAMTTPLAEKRSVKSGTAPVIRGFRQLFRPGTTFKLLLAIENDDNARAAIRVTHALTARGAIPSVVTATEMMIPTPGTPNSMMMYAEAALGEDFHEEKRRDLRALIAGTVGKAQGWAVTSVIGDPALVIVEELKVQSSELVVVGIHQHGSFEQAMGENTATRVMGRAPVPVLGVRPALLGLPRRIMVATDFGDASHEAAHLAANLAEPGGCVILVHASLPYPIVEEGDEGAALLQREGIEHAFVHLSEEIREGKSIQVETVSRSGDAGAQLIAAATLISPDLIVIASQRHHLITRLLLGSVSRKLVREGCWPVLVTPPAGR